MNITLRFHGAAVGKVRDAFLNDDVWYGTFHSMPIDESTLSKRVTDYVRFCEKWNEKCRTGSADVQEFEQFSDVIASGSWIAESDELDRRYEIENAPTFFLGGEASFRELT